MSKRDEPRCDHDRSEVIVTNQPHAWDRNRPHASTWVCSDAGCVIDAMGWVQRFTKEKPWWRIGVDGDWRDDMYPADVEIERQER